MTTEVLDRRLPSLEAISDTLPENSQFFESGVWELLNSRSCLCGSYAYGEDITELPSLSLTSGLDKLECLYLTITFESSLTFAGNLSLPKKETSERCSNWVGSGLALRF
jgi:hypothetical protein